MKLHVRSGWDDIKGEIGPKSEKGERYVPVPETLRALLAQHLLRTGRKERDLVFGKTATAPFVPCTIGDHATKAWTKARLEPIGLHEARHTYVSVMHAAGLSLEQIGDYVGHSSSYMTDRYRHLLDGHEQEAAERFEQYLAGAHTGAQRR
ncbi:MAG TPA: tyrosine-type recombinase/integrase [Gaiellaceae bacterium]|nr:tyrosine-type recombinase/integrase [Gaiellaceae bacterium]